MAAKVYVRAVRLALACAGIAVLSACGGGGGGGGGSGGGGGGGGGGGPQPLIYGGVTTAAVITPTNASRIAANMMGSGDAAVLGGVAGVQVVAVSGQAPNVPGLTRRLDRALRLDQLTRAGGPMSVLAALNVNETDNCDSGTVQIQGTVSDTDATGTLTVTYSACRTGTDTLSGTATMRIDAFNTGFGIITDFTITYARVTFTSPGASADLSGTLRSQVTIATNTEILTENFITLNNSTGLMTKTENMQVVNVYNSMLSPSSFSESVSGRVFDSAAGYVDLTTTTPVFFSTLSQSFPDSGQVLISGAANSRIRLSALSAVLTKIDLDANGDGSFETSATLKWTDLLGPIGSDLADSDGDGMPNGWESAYGLDPHSAADAAADKDGDGASNLLEYIAGTDPTNAASLPTPVSLALTMSAPSTAVVGTNMTYSFTVSNSSSASAANVIVTDNLPAGVTFVSAGSGQGTCTGTSTVTCSLGTLLAFDNELITITVQPTVLGVLSNSVSVASSSFETNLLDNSVTATTTVGAATVNLSVVMTDSPNPVPQGGSLAYTVNVTNNSANPAANVVLTDNLPAAATFVSATTSQGSCTGTTSLSCNLGTLAAFSSATVTINVTAGTHGVLGSTVSVATSSSEPNLSDNSATVSTTVGAASSGLQALIDAAVPGVPVIVPPGVYAGGVNFNGRNVVLQSQNGPAATIITGGGTVVQMGPGGTLQGFTITGGTATFGSGLAVSGTGSLITGNIFDGNAQGAGGYGAAIGGNVASPTIERNIFRNNTCDTQWLSGVVSFINGSSPRIVNNVFENNPCAAINMTLPQGNAPQVVNNTFVGNAVGVRVSRQVPQTTEIYRNNIFVGNGVALKFDFGSDADNPAWTNNLLFANTTDYVSTASQTGANGNISADPLFVDQAAGNYRLQAGSPAINAGSILNAPAVDFDGTSRSGAIDIGAFEH